MFFELTPDHTLNYQLWDVMEVKLKEQGEEFVRHPVVSVSIDILDILACPEWY